MNVIELAEWFARVRSLMDRRGMSYRGAKTVVDAAMFGIGCLEGEVRERIAKEQS